MFSQHPNKNLIFFLNSILLITYKVEEDFWKQRSRELWLTLGDSNTGYFHASTKRRKAENRLTVMVDDEDKPSYEEEQIAALISSYYDKLFTSSGTDESTTVTEAIEPCISQDQNVEFIREPTYAEKRSYLCNSY